MSGAFRLGLCLCLLAGAAAGQGARVAIIEQELPVSEVRALAQAQGVDLHFLGQADPPAARALGRIDSGPHERRMPAAGPTPNAAETCNAALADAIAALAAEAKAIGATRVSAINTGYAPQEVRPGDHYLCSRMIYPGREPEGRLVRLHGLAEVAEREGGSGGTSAGTD